MLDVASFLNSKDIAAHWRKIGFCAQCTPLQAAYLVWQNDRMTLPQRHAAWEEIAALPDCGEGLAARLYR